MAKEIITTVSGGDGLPPAKYNHLKTFNVDSITQTNEEIRDLLTQKEFILKSKRGWQHKKIVFPGEKEPLSNIYSVASIDEIDAARDAAKAAASARVSTPQIHWNLEEVDAALEARKNAFSPFRLRRKKLPKSGKKVAKKSDKKSGKVRKNKRKTRL
jgi:hypothetical protein